MILCKRVKNIHLQSFLSGKLYMKKLKYYIELEEKWGDSFIGDREEGTLTRLIKTGDENSDIIAVKSRSGEEWPAFCLTAVFQKAGNSENNNKYRCCYPGVFLDGIDQNEYSIVILNTRKFKERCFAAMKQAGIEGYAGLVYYTDSEKEKADFIEQGVLPEFIKRKKYTQQSEYRILLKKETKKNFFILEVGDIRDIAEVVPCRCLEK